MCTAELTRNWVAVESCLVSRCYSHSGRNSGCLSVSEYRKASARIPMQTEDSETQEKHPVSKTYVSISH